LNGVSIVPFEHLLAWPWPSGFKRLVKGRVHSCKALAGHRTGPLLLCCSCLSLDYPACLQLCLCLCLVAKSGARCTIEHLSSSIFSVQLDFASVGQAYLQDIVRTDLSCEKIKASAKEKHEGRDEAERIHNHATDTRAKQPNGDAGGQHAAYFQEVSHSATFGYHPVDNLSRHLGQQNAPHLCTPFSGSYRHAVILLRPYTENATLPRMQLPVKGPQRKKLARCNDRETPRQSLRTQTEEVHQLIDCSLSCRSITE
jgi:hypothetical protein